jgi:hypothetical protein
MSVVFSDRILVGRFCYTHEGSAFCNIRHTYLAGFFCQVSFIERRFDFCDTLHT